MKLSYETLLIHLITEYNDKLFNDQTNPSTSLLSRNNKRKRFSEIDAVFSSKEDELEEIDDDILHVWMLRRGNVDAELKSDEQGRKKRGKYNTIDKFFTNPDTGERTKMTFLHSIWFQRYVVNPGTGKKWDEMFRQRFRMPYSSYLDVLGWCSEYPPMKRWQIYASSDFRKRKTKVGVPLDLLVLSGLRYIGRGWTIDDLSEVTVVSYEVIRNFIHKFITWGGTVLYDKFVIQPNNEDELKKHSSSYTMAGFPGCIGSTDATHIVMENCAYRLRQLHLGYKDTHTARTYNLTCDHRRRIISTTSGHPARFNDKTLITFDTFMNELRDGKFDKTFSFELYDTNSCDEIIKVKYRGCYVIVDNGYHNWSITIPPIKSTTLRSEIRFSEWLESMRKDVECCFGILKGRFRILKYGVRLYGVNKCDMVWKTCCALHNMLLDVDGLCDGWEVGNRSVYEVELDNQSSLPFALRRLINPGQSRNIDTSNIGLGNDVKRTVTLPQDINVDSGDADIDDKVVRNISFHQFRYKLMKHFNIAFMRKEVEWPVRNVNIMKEVLD